MLADLDRFNILVCAIPSIVAAGCAIVVGHNWKKRSASQHSFFWTLFCLAVSTTYFFAFQIPGFQRFHRLDWLLTTVGSLVPALYYIYICRLAGDEPKRKKTGGFLMPGFVAFINLVLYMLMGDSQSGDYLNDVIINGHLDFTNYPVLWIVKRFAASYLYRYMLLAQGLYILIISIKKIHNFHKKLGEFYSITGTSDFNGIKVIRFSAMFLFVALGLLCSVPYSVYSGNAKFMLIIVLLISAGGILMTYYVLKQKLTNEELLLLEEDTGNLSLGLKTMDSLKDRLESAIASGFYTDSDVTIMSLADQLKTNRTYLSEVIHTNYGMSFSNFVNDLRIKKAVNEMRVIPLNSPLTRVALKCGYSSYTSFARNFEIFAHCTPSEWMKRYR